MSSVCLIGVKPWMGGMFILDRISLTSHHLLKLVHNPLPSLFQAVGTDEGEAGFCSGCHATVAKYFLVVLSLLWERKYRRRIAC